MILTKHVVSTKIVKVHEKIILADARYPAFGLIYIAQAKGYFDQEGVDVSLRSFTLGKEALSDVIAGNSDIATVYEVPVVRKLYERNKLSIISSLHTSTKGTAILAWKASGIAAPQDLKGKRIAVVKGVNSEFLLFNFLTSLGLKTSDITAVYVDTSELVSTFEKKDVDAVAIYNPLLYQEQQKYKDQAEVFFSDTYTENSMLVGTTERIVSKKDELTRMLRALKKAETFTQTNKEESIKIVTAANPATDEATIRGTWDSIHFTLALNNVLVTILNREGNWYKDSGTYQGALPDFRSAIYPNYLQSVDPEEVTVY